MASDINVRINHWYELPDEPEGVLPEMFADVLVWSAGCGYGPDDPFEPYIARREPNGWSSKDSRIGTYKITHWRPLPDTPK